MYLCTHIYICIYTYIYVLIYYIYVYTCTYTHVYVYFHENMYIHLIMGRIPNLAMKRQYTGTKLPCFRIVRTWFLSFFLEPVTSFYTAQDPSVGRQIVKHLTRAPKCRTLSSSRKLMKVKGKLMKLALWGDEHGRQPH